jgi:hypothetical protein
MRRWMRVIATITLLPAAVLPACTNDQHDFSDGRELLEATGVCAGPIEKRNDASWSCPSGRPDDPGEALIVAEVRGDPTVMRETLNELLEFAWMLDTVVVGEHWCVFGLSSQQASQVIDAVGGRVVAHERTRPKWPRVA